MARGERRKAESLWRGALPGELASVRRRLGVPIDERIPDAVLLIEAKHYFSLSAYAEEAFRWSPDL